MLIQLSAVVPGALLLVPPVVLAGSLGSSVLFLMPMTGATQVSVGAHGSPVSCWVFPGTVPWASWLALPRDTTLDITAARPRQQAGASAAIGSGH